MKNTILIFTLISSLFVFNSCKDNTGCSDVAAVNFDADAEEDDGSCTYPSVSVDINHKVGTEDFVEESEYTINGVKMRIDRVQYYLAELNVTGDNPTEFTDKILLVDPETVNYTLGDAKVGHAHMIRFNVGVPADLNTNVDPATYASDNPLAFQTESMHWSWQSGYKFFVLEGKIDSDGDDVVDSDLEIHLGSDGFYTPVMIEVHNDVVSASHSIHLQMDIANLFTGISDIASNSVTHVGDNLGLAEAIQANLPSAFSHE